MDGERRFHRHHQPDPEQLVYEYAGIIGINPEPLTLRGLELMITGKLRADWDRTAAAMALYINAHRVKGQAINPAELNPYREHRRAVKLNGAAAVAALKDFMQGG